MIDRDKYYKTRDMQNVVGITIQSLMFSQPEMLPAGKLSRLKRLLNTANQAKKKSSPYSQDNEYKK